MATTITSVVATPTSTGLEAIAVAPRAGGSLAASQQVVEQRVTPLFGPLSTAGVRALGRWLARAAVPVARGSWCRRRRSVPPAARLRLRWSLLLASVAFAGASRRLPGIILISVRDEPLDVAARRGSTAALALELRAAGSWPSSRSSGVIA